MENPLSLSNGMLGNSARLPSIGKKPNALPPIKSDNNNNNNRRTSHEHSTHYTQMETTPRGMNTPRYTSYNESIHSNDNNHNEGINNGSIHNGSIHNERLSNNDIKASDEYIGLLIKQNKDASKQRLSDFDKLCETLVTKREEDIRSRNKQKNSLNNKLRSFDHSVGKRDNKLDMRQTFVSQGEDPASRNNERNSANNRLNGFHYSEETHDNFDRSKNMSDSYSNESIMIQAQNNIKNDGNEDRNNSGRQRTRQERPKTARYGGRKTDRTRPRTGYGQKR